MSKNFSEELKKELVKQAVKSSDAPFKMLTVKDMAKVYIWEKIKQTKYLIVRTFHLLI